MLSLSGVSVAQGMSYFEKDDYYFSAGKGRGELDLAGKTISQKDFESLIWERIEKTGGDLDGKDRLADDLTFSAPKSVSIVAALDDNMREQIIRVHQEAIREVLNYIRKSGMIQTRENGQIVEAKNAYAVAFDHFLSRDLDPQLHTHVLLANTDGERALYLREIYINKVAIGTMYRHELADRLEKMGYSVEWKKDGTFELKGFTQEQLRAFSSRREAIEAALQEKGLDGGKAAEIAAKDTRKAKKEVDPGQVRELWEQKAKEVGIKLPEPSILKVYQKKEAEKGPSFVQLENKLVEARDVISKTLETAGFTMDLRNELALAQVLAREGHTSNIREIKELARKALEDVVKDRGGKVYLDQDNMDRERYTTHDNLSANLRTRLEGIREKQLGIDSEKAEKIFSTFNDWLEKEKGFRIEGDQVRAVLGVATSDKDVFIIGKAGAGKTTIMQAVREIYQADGKTVIGLAPSGLAADNLQKEAGIKSMTVDSMAFISEEKVAKQFGGPEKIKGGLIIVDEAGMLDAKRLAAVQEFANKYEMKIAYVGDPDQIKPVGQGDPTLSIVKEAGQKGTLYQLTEIFRQKDKDYQEASVQAATGNTIGSLGKLQELGWVYEISSRGERIKAATEKYLEAIRDQKSILVVTESNTLKDRLNREIRYALQKEGLVKEDGLTSKVKGLDGREAGEKEFALGDKVIFLRNNRSLGVLNGQTGEIVSIDKETQTITVKTQEGEKNIDLNKYNFVDHAYAVTVHKSQGQTVDRVVYVQDEKSKMLTANLYYVAITRGREEATVLAANLEQLKKQITVDQDKKDVLSWRAAIQKIDLDQEIQVARELQARSGQTEKNAIEKTNLKHVINSDKFSLYQAQKKIRESIKEGIARETWREMSPEDKTAVLTGREKPDTKQRIEGTAEKLITKKHEKQWRPESARPDSKSIWEQIKTGGIAKNQYHYHLKQRNHLRAEIWGMVYGLRPEQIRRDFAYQELKQKDGNADWKFKMKYGFSMSKYSDAIKKDEWKHATNWGKLSGVPEKINRRIAIEKATRGENPRSIKLLLQHGFDGARTAEKALKNMEKEQKIREEKQKDSLTLADIIRSEVKLFVNEIKSKDQPSRNEDAKHIAKEKQELARSTEEKEKSENLEQERNSNQGQDQSQDKGPKMDLS